MRKSIVLTIIAILGVMFISFARADDVINIRLSYKVVLNPATGTRPPGVTDADIDNAITAMNALEETYFRGFRFVRVDPIRNVGGLGGLTGPSQWYNTNFFNDTTNAKDRMEAAALANPTLYAWNANAVNLYFTNGICGGICSFPSERDNIIIIGGCSDNNGPLQLHEIGHYFELCHTQGCRCGDCIAGRTGSCHTIPGDDLVADTLPDLECWNQDNIANWTFATTYASLTPAQKQQVDDVFLNVMSYHSGRSRMTELQLDRWTDIANASRRIAADGRTYFVQVSASIIENGTSLFPFNRVIEGVAAAALAGDIVLLRPGAYNETITIGTGNKAVTLRATRRGPVVIGSPNVSTFIVSQSPEEIDAALQKIPGIASDRGEAQLGFAGSKDER